MRSLQSKSLKKRINSSINTFNQITMKQKNFLIQFAALIFVVAVVTLSSCKKDDFPVVNHQGEEENPIEIGMGSLKYANGDTASVATGIPTVLYIDNPVPGVYYNWDFCGTSYPGSPTNLQTNILYTFPATPNPCTVTVTGSDGSSMSFTVYIGPIPFTGEALYLMSATLNGDGTYTYNLAGRKSRINPLAAGAYGQVGDHTTWVVQYSATCAYVPALADTFVQFSLNTANQIFKLNYVRGTYWSDPTGSLYESPSIVDNNYEVYFWNGTINAPTFAPTIVSPGAVGDNTGPVRMTEVNDSVYMYFNIHDFCPAAFTSPHWDYRIDAGLWTNNVPLTYSDGSGWASYGMDISSMTNTFVLYFNAGCTGGDINGTTSTFWNSGLGCFAVQFTLVTPFAPVPGGGPSWTISPYKGNGND